MNFDAVKTCAPNALRGVTKFFYRMIYFLMGHRTRNITVLLRRRCRRGERRLAFQSVGISGSAGMI